MKNLKISYKFTLCLGLSLLVLISVGITSVFSIQRLDSQFEDFHDDAYVLSRNILTARMEFDEVGKVLANIITTGTGEEILNAHDSATALYDSSTAYFASLSTRENSSQEFLDIVANINNEILLNSQSRDLIVQYAQSGDTKMASDTFFGEYFSSFSTTIVHMQSLIDYVDVYAEEAYNEVIRYESMITLVLIILSASAVILTIVLGIILVRSFETPIKKLQKSLAAISQGNLKEASIDYKSKDEFGELANNISTTVDIVGRITADLTQGFTSLAEGNFDCNDPDSEVYVGDFEIILHKINEFLIKMSYTINQVTTASNQVMIGSEQVSAGAQVLTTGTINQAESVQELADIIATFSSQVNDINHHSKNAASVALDTKQNINASNDKMKQLIISMNEIESNSKEISKISKTIEDIAFQTNILALNAAVEAARAGEAGKGFAVVADEVRSLAAKSAEAAQSTTSLIDTSISSINRGVSLSQVVASEIIGVVGIADEVNNSVQSILELTDTQLESIAIVSDELETISSVVHTNSATSEESTAASEELASQASILNSLTASFNTIKNSETL